MKSLVIISSLLIGLSSCIIEVELEPPYLEIGNIKEYETKEVLHESWSDGVLIYEDADYHAWLEIEFHNTGGVRAKNVSAEVIFYNGHREIQTTTVFLPNIHSGNSYTYSLDTGFESIYDYSDYEVHVFWE